MLQFAQLALVRSLAHATRMSAVRHASAVATAAVQISPGSVDGVVRMTLTSPPANTLTLESLGELDAALAGLESDPAVLGVVVTSASPKIFSAGIDLKELLSPDTARLRAFWKAMQLFYARLFGTSLATAAAIDGHALAGGCITALACDHRVMSRGTIGLNEAALGLPPPWWINDLLCRVVGESRGEQMLQGASTLTPQQALEVGLIDNLASNDMPSVDVAEKLLARLVNVPGRAGVKAQRRGRFVADMRARIHIDTDDFVEVITSYEMQSELERYITSLQRKQ